MPEKEIDVDVCVRVCVGDFLLWINATTMQWKWILIFISSSSRILLLLPSSSSELLLLLLLLLLRDPPLLQKSSEVYLLLILLLCPETCSFLSSEVFFRSPSFFWASCFIISSVRVWGMMGCMQPQCNGMMPELLSLLLWNSSSSSSDIFFRTPYSFSIRSSIRVWGMTGQKSSTCSVADNFFWVKMRTPGLAFAFSFYCLASLVKAEIRSVCCSLFAQLHRCYLELK